MFSTEQRAASRSPEISLIITNQDRDSIKDSMQGMMEKGGMKEGERELNDREDKNIEMQTWISALQAQPVPSPPPPPHPPLFKVNKMAKPQYLPLSEDERELETEIRTREACRRTALTL